MAPLETAFVPQFELPKFDTEYARSEIFGLTGLVKTNFPDVYVRVREGKLQHFLRNGFVSQVIARNRRLGARFASAGSEGSPEGERHA